MVGVGSATILGALAALALVVWVVTDFGGAFGVLLWATPLIPIAIAVGVAGVAFFEGLREGLAALVVALVVAIVCLYVLAVPYSFVVAVWPGSPSNCPEVLTHLPKGRELCAADDSGADSWGPPFFQFGQ